MSGVVIATPRWAAMRQTRLGFVLDLSLVDRKLIVHVAFALQINKETSYWHFTSQHKTHILLIFIACTSDPRLPSKSLLLHTVNALYLVTTHFRLPACIPLLVREKRRERKSFFQDNTVIFERKWYKTKQVLGPP